MLLPDKTDVVEPVIVKEFDVILAPIVNPDALELVTLIAPSRVEEPTFELKVMAPDPGVIVRSWLPADAPLSVLLKETAPFVVTMVEVPVSCVAIGTVRDAEPNVILAPI